MTNTQSLSVKEEIRGILDEFDDHLTIQNPDDKQYERIRNTYLSDILTLFSDYIQNNMPEKKELLNVKPKDKELKDQFPYDLGEVMGFNQALDDTIEKLLEGLK